MATAGPFNVGRMDSSDDESNFSRSLAGPICLSSIDAVASACRLARDRELTGALPSDVVLVVMTTSPPANDTLSLTDLDDVAAAARFDNDDTLPTASDGRTDDRLLLCSAKDDDFSAANNVHYLFYALYDHVNPLTPTVAMWVHPVPEAVICNF